MQLKCAFTVYKIIYRFNKSKKNVEVLLIYMFMYDVEILCVSFSDVLSL